MSESKKGKKDKKDKKDKKEGKKESRTESAGGESVEDRKSRGKKKSKTDQDEGGGRKKSDAGMEKRKSKTDADMEDELEAEAEEATENQEELFFLQEDEDTDNRTLSRSASRSSNSEKGKKDKKGSRGSTSSLSRDKTDKKGKDDSKKKKSDTGLGKKGKEDTKKGSTVKKDKSEKGEMRQSVESQEVEDRKSRSGRTENKDDECPGPHGIIVYQIEVRFINFKGIKFSGGVRVLMNCPQGAAYLQLLTLMNEVFASYDISHMFYLQSASAAGVSFCAMSYEETERKGEPEEEKEEEEGDEQTKCESEEIKEWKQRMKDKKRSAPLIDHVEIVFCTPEQLCRFKTVMDTLLIIVTAEDEACSQAEEDDPPARRTPEPKPYPARGADNYTDNYTAARGADNYTAARGADNYTDGGGGVGEGGARGYENDPSSSACQMGSNRPKTPNRPGMNSVAHPISCRQLKMLQAAQAYPGNSQPMGQLQPQGQGMRQGAMGQPQDQGMRQGSMGQMGQMQGQGQMMQGQGQMMQGQGQMMQGQGQMRGSQGQMRGSQMMQDQSDYSPSPFQGQGVGGRSSVGAPGARPYGMQQQQNDPSGRMSNGYGGRPESSPGSSHHGQLPQINTAPCDTNDPFEQCNRDDGGRPVFTTTACLRVCWRTGETIVYKGKLKIVQGSGGIGFLIRIEDATGSTLYCHSLRRDLDLHDTDDVPYGFFYTTVVCMDGRTSMETFVVAFPNELLKEQFQQAVDACKEILAMTSVQCLINGR